MTNEIAACSLNGSDLPTRIEAWKRVAAQATNREVEKSRIVSTYPSDPWLIEELRALIAAEAECCSFMQFTLDETGDEVVVELQVPEDMSATLGMMLGFVTEQSAASH